MNTEDISKSAAILGKKGGDATLKNKGRSYFSKIAKIKRASRKKQIKK